MTLGHPREPGDTVGIRQMAAEDLAIAHRLWPAAVGDGRALAVRPAPGLPLFHCTVCGRAPDRLDYRQDSDGGPPSLDAPILHHVLVECHGGRGSWSCSQFELDSFRFPLEGIELPDFGKRWGAMR